MERIKGIKERTYLIKINMEKIKKYYMLSEKSIELFNNAIEIAIWDCWQPYWNPIMKEWYYAQALVKYN